MAPPKFNPDRPSGFGVTTEPHARWITQGGWKYDPVTRELLPGQHEKADPQFAAGELGWVAKAFVDAGEFGRIRLPKGQTEEVTEDGAAPTDPVTEESNIEKEHSIRLFAGGVRLFEEETNRLAGVTAIADPELMPVTPVPEPFPEEKTVVRGPGGGEVTFGEPAEETNPEGAQGAGMPTILLGAGGNLQGTAAEILKSVEASRKKSGKGK